MLVILSPNKPVHQQQSTMTAAKRCLFGPVDHQELQNLLKKELFALEKENRLKYNFDFKRERPLQGGYKWTPVPEDGETVPPAYEIPALTSLDRKSVLGDLTVNVIVNIQQVNTSIKSAVKSETCRRVLRPRRRCLKQAPSSCRALSWSPKPSPTKRTVDITDYFPQQKMAKLEGVSC